MSNDMPRAKFQPSLGCIICSISNWYVSGDGGPKLDCVVCPNCTATIFRSVWLVSSVCTILVGKAQRWQRPLSTRRGALCADETISHLFPVDGPLLLRARIRPKVLGQECR